MNKLFTRIFGILFWIAVAAGVVFGFMYNVVVGILLLVIIGLIGFFFYILENFKIKF